MKIYVLSLLQYKHAHYAYTDQGQCGQKSPQEDPWLTERELATKQAVGVSPTSHQQHLYLKHTIMGDNYIKDVISVLIQVIDLFYMYFILTILFQK